MYKNYRINIIIIFSILIPVIFVFFSCSKDKESRSKELKIEVVQYEGINKYKIPFKQFYLFQSEIFSLRDQIREIVRNRPQKDSWETEEEYTKRILDSLKVFNVRAEKIIIDKYSEILVKVDHLPILPNWLVENDYYSYPLEPSVAKNMYNYYYKLLCFTSIPIDTLYYDPDQSRLELVANFNVNNLSQQDNDEYYVTYDDWGLFAGLVSKWSCYTDRFDLFSIYLSDFPRDKAKKISDLIEQKRIFVDLHYHYKFGYLFHYVPKKSNSYKKAGAYYNNIFEVNGIYDDFYEILVDSMKIFHGEAKLEKDGWSRKLESYNQELLSK